MATLSHPQDPAAAAAQGEALLLHATIEDGLACLVKGRLDDSLEALRRMCPTRERTLDTLLDSLQEIAVRFAQVERLLREASQALAEAREAWQEQLAALSAYLADEPPADESALLREQLVRGTLPRGAPAESQDQPGASALVRLVVQPHGPDADGRPTSAAATVAAGLLEEREATLPSLYVTCFGQFSVRRFRRDGPPVVLCRSGRGQAVLRYLLTRANHQASIDALLADLWPDEEAETARHKLQIAVSALRCSLNEHYSRAPGAGYVLCKERTYLLNPAAGVHTDLAEFHELFQAGRRADQTGTTAEYYRRACQLYTGPLLSEDLYAEWAQLAREEALRIYRTMCGWLAEYALEVGEPQEALERVQVLLRLDRYDEEAYRQGMRAAAALGRRGEVLRCYQQCRQVLLDELGIEPLPETRALLQRLLGS
jgi:DNA-binding SARP family transcriptional activator